MSSPLFSPRHAGDHFLGQYAQKLDNHIGKIVRITPDGAVPPGNPFVDLPGALPEIWAYGLRNAQGLAFNPADGKLKILGNAPGEYVLTKAK